MISIGVTVRTVSRLTASVKREKCSLENIETRSALKHVAMNENRPVVTRAKGSAVRDNGRVECVVLPKVNRRKVNSQFEGILLVGVTARRS